MPKIKIKKLKLRFFLVGTYVSLFCLIHFPLKGQVSFIDVGQGDSILITTPFNRKTYLIDTGGKLNFGKRKSQLLILFIKDWFSVNPFAKYSLSTEI